MYEPRFRLVSETAEPTQQKSRQWISRVLIASILTLALALGAIYSPVLWGNQPASANTRFQEAGTAQLIMDTSLFNDQDALANLYEFVAPSVVSIQVQAVSQSSSFRQPQQGVGQGSGWIYDNEGHIVTNNHVVEDAEAVTVLFNNGMWADAEVVATDPQADLAVIKVEPPANFEWRALPLAEPDALRVGHSVIAVGNPFGLDSTMTTGIVSALGRGQPVGSGESRYTLPEVIQTDAAINPGNSGGPLINLNGEVVGVNFAIRSAVRSNSGVGFTIPVSIVQRIVPALINDGGFSYPFLGLSGRTIDAAAAETFNLSDNQLGIYVANVVRGGPSADAGIIGAEDGSGDIIIAINGESVRSFEDMVGYLVTETSPEQTVTMTVLRDGSELLIDVTLGYRPGSPRLTNTQAPELQDVNARDAIGIAIDAVQGDNLVDADITQKVAIPDEVNGEPVWIVELTAGSQVATVTVSRVTGEVIEIVVE